MISERKLHVRTMMFAHDIVICSESKERLAEKLESWICFGEKRNETQ